MVSVIIPVFNEEKTIAKSLSQFENLNDVELIVVDGGSSDNTAAIVKSFNVKYFQTKPNRAFQMNYGAQEAKGDILLFLHCDCFLEKGSLADIEECIEDGFGGGCLTHKILSPKWIYRCIESSGNFRASVSNVFFGDQAIFVKRELFLELGAFPELDLFEDVVFSKNLKKKAKVTILRNRVFASPRRWENLGVVKTTLLNWFLSVGFLLGVSPKNLKKFYKNVR